MDYAFLSKEGRGSQVVMEKAEGSGDRHVSETYTEPMVALIDFWINLTFLLLITLCNEYLFIVVHWQTMDD